MNFKELGEQQHQFCNYGNIKPYVARQKGYLIYLGPHWYVHFSGCLIFTSIILILHLSMNIKFIWRVCSGVWHLSTILVFILIGLCNPGIAAQQKYDLPYLAQKYCSVCKIIRQKKTVHCRDCNTCILDYDHHCPWVGKCIGKGNIIMFYMFLILIFGSIVIGAIDALST